MNVRITVTAAIAFGALFALAPAQAQAPGTGINPQITQNLQATQRLESQVQALQIQISQLQAQVRQLQARLQSASPASGSADRPFTLTLPSGKTVVVPARPPQRLSNIPNCQVTLLKAAR